MFAWSDMDDDGKKTWVPESPSKKRKPDRPKSSMNRVRFGWAPRPSPSDAMHPSSRKPDSPGMTKVPNV
jgi:hypothetical protein